MYVLSIRGLLIPRPSARYRPRAEAGLLSRLIQEAWEAKRAREYPEHEAKRVGEILATWGENLRPQSDTAILEKYGFVEKTDRISVAVCDPEADICAYAERFSLDLPRNVLAVRGDLSCYACTPRYSTYPDRGVTEKYRVELEMKGEWDKFCADQDARDARLPPAEIDPFFAALLAARKAFKREYAASSVWPAKRKAETGEWPTWREIADAWPVLGEHLRGLWSADNAKKAA